MQEWSNHIQTLYHGVSGCIWKNRNAYCWTGNRNVAPHEREGCDECRKRMQNVRNRLPEWHDPEKYVKDDDVDAVAAEAEHEAPQPSGSYRCTTCNVTCFSKEFWERHVTGKKHQTKIKSTTKRKAPPPPTHVVTPPKKTKVDSKQKSETKTTSSIVTTDGSDRYCEACDQFVKQAKNNWSRHIKTKKHRNNTRDQWTTHDEAEEISGDDPVRDASFATPGNPAVPGKHFLIEFDEPIKYKLAEQVSRRLFCCTDCGVRFQTSWHLQRHMQSSTEIHRQMKEAAQQMEAMVLEMRVRKGRADTTGESHDQPIVIDDDDKDKKLPEVTIDDCESEAERINLEKYQACQLLLNQKNFIEKIAICNEFTGSLLPHSHSHVYMVTRDKHFFKEITTYFQEEFRLTIKDIQRPRDLLKACRYVTKNDRQAMAYNIPLKHCATTWRAYLYAQSHKKVNWGHDIPASIAPCDRANFMDVVAEEVTKNEAMLISQRTEKNLLAWQEKLLQLISEPGNQRSVFWVVDVVGHGGKSFMAQYLMRNGRGIIFTNFAHRDNSLLYDGEELVMSDIPRDTPLEECSLQFLEDLKNGYIISQKYETRKKVFKIPTVVVFSNSFPVKEKLSLDRWKVYNLMLLDDHAWVLELDDSYNRP